MIFNRPGKSWKCDVSSIITRTVGGKSKNTLLIHKKFRKRDIMCLRITNILSTTLCEHHVQNFSTLKLDEIKIQNQIYSIWQFPDLRVQPGSHCGRPKLHYKSLKIISKVSVSRKILCRNVCKSQNIMKPFFSIYHGLKMCFASPTNSPGNYWGYIKFSGLS